MGTFSRTEASEHALAYKDGMLFLTRDSTTRAAPESRAEQTGAASQSQPTGSDRNGKSEAGGSAR